jgi:HSP20 family protein
VATLVRWEPIRELASLQTEMSRLLNGAFEGGRVPQNWVPPVDVWETDRQLVYAFDLPGVAEEEIQIELQEDTLTVTAKRERDDERAEDGFVRFERRFGILTRALAVPAGVTEENISASYRDGVLEIRVAKPEAPEAKRIRIGNVAQATIEQK